MPLRSMYAAATILQYACHYCSKQLFALSDSESDGYSTVGSLLCELVICCEG